jgi:hypothetical protein
MIEAVRSFETSVICIRLRVTTYQKIVLCRRRKISENFVNCYKHKRVLASQPRYRDRGEEHQASYHTNGRQIITFNIITEMHVLTLKLPPSYSVWEVLRVKTMIRVRKTTTQTKRTTKWVLSRYVQRMRAVTGKVFSYALHVQSFNLCVPALPIVRFPSPLSVT